MVDSKPNVNTNNTLRVWGTASQWVTSMTKSASHISMQAITHLSYKFTSSYCFKLFVKFLKKKLKTGHPERGGKMKENRTSLLT